MPPQRLTPKPSTQLTLLKPVIAALNGAPDGIVLLDANSGCIVFANPSFVKLAGRTHDELRQMQIWELHPSNMAETGGKLFRQVLAEGAAKSSILPILRPDGSLRPIELRAWTAQAGEQLLVISSARGISQRIEMQEERELFALHSRELLGLVRELERAETVAEVMDAVHERVKDHIGFQHTSLCRYPVDATHCTRLAMRTSHPRLEGSKDGAAYLIEGDKLMEQIAAGAETQIVPVASLDARLDRPWVEQMGLQTLIRVATGLSSGTRVVLEFVSFHGESVPIPSDLQMDFARGLIAHAGTVVERLEFSKAAMRSAAAITGLHEAVGSETGQEFFDALTKNLAEALGIRHVLLTGLGTSGARVARSISLFSDGKFAPPFEYDLEGTPCDKVRTENIYYAEDRVQELFPTDLDLVDFEARSFLGICMISTDGEILGHISVMDDKPFEDPSLVEQVCRLFAARGAAELKRAKARDELAQSLDAQRKVNEILQISSLPKSLHEKLQSALRIILDDCSGAVYAGRIFLVSTADDALNCEAWISRESVQSELVPPTLASHPHRQAMSALEAQPFPTSDSDTSDSQPVERGVILPIHTGGKALGTLGVLSDGAELPPSQIQSWRSTTDALAFLIYSHRAQEALHLSEERLRQSQKLEALGGLAGGIAHDFNNLMTAVLGNAELLLSEVPPDGFAHERGLEIQSAGRSAARLTSQLLAFTRRQVLERDVINLNLLVRESSEMLKRLVPEDIGLRVLTPQEVLHAHADAGQLQQVVMNLVVNARDAMPAGGSLEIQLRTHADDEGALFAILAIRDTGTGMEPEIRERIFEPFFTTKDAGKGTGLGLSVVYGIISQHGGWIDVESVVDQGTTFLIHMPLLPPHKIPAEKAIEESPKALVTPWRALVVEDEAAVRRVTRLMLEQYGHKVITAANGAEALQLFDTAEDLDVILLDVVMPGMSGVEVFREIRQRKPDQPILFVTGHDPTERLRDFEGLPRVGLLRKPYTRADLAKKLADLLGPSKSKAPG